MVLQTEHALELNVQHLTTFKNDSNGDHSSSLAETKRPSRSRCEYYAHHSTSFDRENTLHEIIQKQILISSSSFRNLNSLDFNCSFPYSNINK